MFFILMKSPITMREKYHLTETVIKIIIVSTLPLSDRANMAMLKFSLIPSLNINESQNNIF
jgi:hypothetical protein